MEFDVLDRDTRQFLSTERRQALLAGGPVVSVPILGVGSKLNLEDYIDRSTCSSSEIMEGLYIKHEGNGQVISRYKYVRSSFLQAVADAGDHWMDRPIEPNRLHHGVDLFS
jgi:hypothetical protein